jgi:methylmalonyl-CoA/ethylmalonyl-CoA epimerase
MLRQTLRRLTGEAGKAPFHPSSLGRLNHVAIAVPKSTTLEAAAKMYAGVLGAKISAPQHLPEHGVTTVFVELPNTKLELLHTLGDKSPIQGFLDKNPSGGMHHLCFEVDDIDASIAQVKAMGVRAIGEKKIGAHGKPVIFLHPKDCGGVLTELEQA